MKLEARPSNETWSRWKIVNCDDYRDVPGEIISADTDAGISSSRCRRSRTATWWLSTARRRPSRKSSGGRRARSRSSGEESSDSVIAASPAALRLTEEDEAAMSNDDPETVRLRIESAVLKTRTRGIGGALRAHEAAGRASTTISYPACGGTQLWLCRGVPKSVEWVLRRQFRLWRSLAASGKGYRNHHSHGCDHANARHRLPTGYRASDPAPIRHSRRGSVRRSPRRLCHLGGRVFAHRHRP